MLGLAACASEPATITCWSEQRAVEDELENQFKSIAMLAFLDTWKQQETQLFPTHHPGHWCKHIDEICEKQRIFSSLHKRLNHFRNTQNVLNSTLC